VRAHSTNVGAVFRAGRRAYGSTRRRGRFFQSVRVSACVGIGAGRCRGCRFVLPPHGERVRLGLAVCVERAAVAGSVQSSGSVGSRPTRGRRRWCLTTRVFAREPNFWPSA